MSNTIPFTQEAVRKYLDDAINQWREQKEGFHYSSQAYDEACCYIDAFQSMRSSLFGETLLLENSTEASDK